jgi:hypothetical protein
MKAEDTAIQSTRIRVGLIEVFRYSLIGVLLCLSFVWVSAVAIVRWTLIVVLSTILVVLGMVCVLGLLVYGGPIGMGLLAGMALFSIGWALEEGD